MKKGMKSIAAFMGMAALMGGMASSALPSNNSAAVQHHATIPGSATIHRHQKRTPLGTAEPGRNRHQFALVPQKHAKHTNRLKCAAKAKRKRMRKGK